MQSEVASLCASGVRPRILCFGAAALRELEPVLSRVLEAGGEVVVVERDATRAGALHPPHVLFVDESAWPLRRNECGAFHLIYAPNLLAEASDAPARRAIARQAALLKRGGKLLLTALSPDVADLHHQTLRAVLRSEEEVGALSLQVPDQYFVGQVVWSDDYGLMIFLEISR